jgi:hypothetical protein
MGRGRQKAKQAKVARALKYETGHTDLDALQAELAGSRSDSKSDSDDFVESDYSAWIDEEDDEADQ